MTNVWESPTHICDRAAGTMMLIIGMMMLIIDSRRGDRPEHNGRAVRQKTVPATETITHNGKQLTVMKVSHARG